MVGVALVVLSLALAYAIICAGNALRDTLQDRNESPDPGDHEDLL